MKLISTQGVEKISGSKFEVAMRIAASLEILLTQQDSKDI